MSIFRRLKIDTSLVSIFKRLKIDEETQHNFRVSGDATKLESPLPSPGYNFYVFLHSKKVLQIVLTSPVIFSLGSTKASAKLPSTIYLS